MKCPQCGYQPPRGRPREIDEKRVIALANQKMSLRGIAKEMGITHSSVRTVLKRKKDK
jgi:hypothetical protein